MAPKALTMLHSGEFRRQKPLLQAAILAHAIACNRVAACPARGLLFDPKGSLGKQIYLGLLP